MLKGVQTTDFAIDPYLSLNDASLFFQEICKKYKVDTSKIEGYGGKIMNPVNTSVQMDQSLIVNGGFKQFITENAHFLEALPEDISKIVIEKAKVKPYQKSVLKFREIMTRSTSPYEKLFQIKGLKDQIQADINEFWGDVITDNSKLVLSRDEMTSILLFLICKSEVPDLNTQVKLMLEFTSSDIQEASKGYPLSDTFMLITTTIQWISSLDPEKISEDRSYLVNAQVQMKED